MIYVSMELTGRGSHGLRKAQLRSERSAPELPVQLLDLKAKRALTPARSRRILRDS